MFSLTSSRHTAEWERGWAGGRVQPNICREADTILRAGGFKIKHWDVSMNATKGEQVDKKTVLGLVWNSCLDTLQIDVKTFDNCVDNCPQRA